MFAISTEALVAECRKFIRKQERYMRKMRDEDVRRKRRTVSPHEATLLRPAYWEVDAGFDPYRVRSNADAIARAVNSALRAGDYRPRPAIAHEVAKPSGGNRIVSVFQIADSVVSRHIYEALLSKNVARMSARSYAYRPDLSTHDAIQYISSEFATSSRMYIAEYDFSKYFDSIQHEYLWRALERNRFLVTPSEQRVIGAFLRTPLLSVSDYDVAAAESECSVGLPQGTSISLFLANVAACEMDRRLERLGVGFARYADDTLIWSQEYGQIAEAANVLRQASEEVGAKLNLKKSKGVRLYVPPGEPAEIEATSEVDFVGYRFSNGCIGLRSTVVARIKARIEYLIWSNLLQAHQQGTFNPDRVLPPLDRDYLVLMLQLRRYLYGNLTESKVREFQRGAVKRMRYPGVMSYFPLVDDVAQLRQLDGWILSTVFQALRKRAKFLTSSGIGPLPAPHGLVQEELVRARGTTSSGKRVDLTMPSVTRFASVLHQAAVLFGANVVGRGTGADEYRYMLSGL